MPECPYCDKEIDEKHFWEVDNQPDGRGSVCFEEMVFANTGYTDCPHCGGRLRVSVDCSVVLEKFIKP